MLTNVEYTVFLYLLDYFFKSLFCTAYQTKYVRQKNIYVRLPLPAKAAVFVPKRHQLTRVQQTTQHGYQDVCDDSLDSCA